MAVGSTAIGQQVIDRFLRRAHDRLSELSPRECHVLSQSADVNRRVRAALMWLAAPQSGAGTDAEGIG